MSEKSKIIFAPESNRSDVSTANTSWLEWKDSDLNNEKWGIPKNGPDGLFLDVETVAMPRSLKPYEWIRAKDLKQLTAPLTVYTTTAGNPDLITNNKHLLHSEFMRWFISALTNLQYCGRDGLEISGEDTNFIWLGRYQPWYGWTHVYSLNKAGKGAQHQPVINPNGKYIVRLYCVGCWRRILIDDIIPVDKDGRPLLPCTSNNFELWPMLLAKALLKIASSTWTERREIVDFHPIACLTGWICLTLSIKHLSVQDKWDLLMKYSEHFEWMSQNAEVNTLESSKNVTNDKTKKFKNNPLFPIKEEKSQPVILFLFFSDTRELGNDAVTNLSPGWDHIILVTQARDVPLDPEDVKPPLARWKLYRWLNWAVSENLIDPANYFVPIRYLQIINPLQECSDNLLYNYDEIDNEKKSIIGELNKSIQKETRSQNITEISITTETFIDISRVDFNKIASYVTEIHLFYKLQYFQCSVQLISDIRITNENRRATKEINKERTDTYNLPRKILKPRDEPLYLLCDSLEKKFFLVNLSVAVGKTNTDLCKKDYLILEKHNWFSGSNRSDQLLTISTTGSKSAVIELEEGRQLLQIYCRSESGLATISSNTNFHLGNRSTVQEFMTVESNRIEQLSKSISDSLRKAYQSFGSKNYPATLKEYYRSYMPNWQMISSRNENFRKSIHYIFMEEQVRLIRKAFRDEEFENILHSLQIFFLNPNIKLDYPDPLKRKKDLQDATMAETFKILPSWKSINQEKYNQAAIIIQSFFKMVLVKKYQQFFDPEHALHADISKELQKISDLFDPSLASQWLRNVISRDNNLRELYPCSKDFQHVLQLQELRGVLENIKQNQWCPIARFMMSPKPLEVVYAIFELTIDLPHYALRVLNNDDLREMIHVVNHVTPSRYKYVPTGYTVFAYGRNENQRVKDLDWRIRVITVKGEPMLYQIDERQTLSLDIKPPKLLVEELAGTYIPNARNCISRWILRTASRSSVSIRLMTSYNLVEVRMKVTDEKGNILADVNGGSTILLPLVILEHTVKNEGDQRETNNDTNEEFRNPEEKKSVYYIKAFVLNDSWPLTDSEWTIVHQAKMKNIKYLKTKTLSGNKNSSKLDLLTTRRSSKHFVSDNQALESPYWVLQIVTDALNTIEMCQDYRKEQEIALLKESWCSKDPDRLRRGTELRQVFLNQHALKTAESEIFLDENEEQSIIRETKESAFYISQTKECRTLKPPETHHLPALDLTRYMSKDDDLEKQWVKTESEDDMLSHQCAINIADAQRDYFSFLKNLTKLANKQIWKYKRFFKKTEENIRKRKALIEAAYESRKTYVDTLTLEMERRKGKKN